MTRNHHGNPSAKPLLESSHQAIHGRPYTSAPELNADGYTRNAYKDYHTAISQDARKNRQSADIVHCLCNLCTLAGLLILDIPGPLAGWSWSFAGCGFLACLASYETAALSSELIEKKLSQQDWASAPQGFLDHLYGNGWNIITGFNNWISALFSYLGLTGLIITGMDLFK